MSVVERAGIGDLEEVLRIQKEVFRSEAEIYSRYDISPLHQTIEGIKKEFKDKLFLKLSNGGKIIGSVRAYQDGDTCYIERLAVCKDFQNRGYGTQLMNEIEKYFSDAKRFELATGYKSDRNLYLYQKLGYKIFKTKKYDRDLSFVYFEKSV